MTYLEISERVQKDYLDIFGAFHPKDGGTILLLGPKEPGFWANLTGSDEYRDGLRDPVDRWSYRVFSAIAEDIGGQARFPFTGPPYHPFIQWAAASGRSWPSPAGMLVHDTAGLFVSYRGAIWLPSEIAVPTPNEKPCDSCADQPCTSACPVNALGPDGYDVEACHAYLDKPEGNDCMTQGCKARRSCPVSRGYGRLAEQSAFHMRHFHK